MKTLIWTKKWPKKVGWYWRKCSTCDNDPNIEFVYKGETKDCDGCQWAGPIPYPITKSKIRKNK